MGGKCTKRGVPERPKFFHIPLKELCELYPSDQILPAPLVDMFDMLEIQGRVTEGIFRVSGNYRLIDLLKEKLDRGRLVNFQEVDINDIAGLMKLFLSSLPDPVFTFAHYAEWMALAEEWVKNSGEHFKSNKSITFRESGPVVPLGTELTPQEQRKLQICHQICKLSHTIAGNEKETRMGAYQLSIVIGPNLLRKPKSGEQDNNPFGIVREINLANAIVRNVFEYYTWLLPPEGDVFRKCEETLLRVDRGGEGGGANEGGSSAREDKRPLSYRGDRKEEKRKSEGESSKRRSREDGVAEKRFPPVSPLPSQKYATSAVVEKRMDLANSENGREEVAPTGAEQEDVEGMEAEVVESEEPTTKSLEERAKEHNVKSEVVKEKVVDEESRSLLKGLVEGFEKQQQQMEKMEQFFHLQAQRLAWLEERYDEEHKARRETEEKFEFVKKELGSELNDLWEVVERLEKVTPSKEEAASERDSGKAVSGGARSNIDLEDIKLQLSSLQRVSSYLEDVKRMKRTLSEIEGKISILSSHVDGNDFNLSRVTSDVETLSVRYKDLSTRVEKMSMDIEVEKSQSKRQLMENTSPNELNAGLKAISFSNYLSRIGENSLQNMEEIYTKQQQETGTPFFKKSNLQDLKAQLGGI